MCRYRSILLLCLATLSAGALAETDSKIVIGPTNVALADGAAALKAGDAEEGVRLTERGLKLPTSARERVSGLANLCAGYIMLKRLDEALAYCNQSIEADPEHWHAISNRALVYVLQGEFDLAARDVARAEALAPQARPLKKVKAMLRNAVDPVVPTVTIDDRRRPPTPEPVE